MSWFYIIWCHISLWCNKMLDLTYIHSVLITLLLLLLFLLFLFSSFHSCSLFFPLTFDVFIFCISINSSLSFYLSFYLSYYLYLLISFFFLSFLLFLFIYLFIYFLFTSFPTRYPGSGLIRCLGLLWWI